MKLPKPLREGLRSDYIPKSRSPASLVVPYLGPAWGKRALEVLRTDARVLAAVQGIEVSILTRITDVPEGRYHWLYAAFDGKGLGDARMGDDDAELETLPPPTFTITGPYGTFAAIQRGEVTEHRAFLTGRLHVKGNRLKALRHMGSLETVTKALAGIPCET